MIAVAVKIQPRILERLVALGYDGHLRAFESADVPLPLDDFALLPRIRGIVVSHLANEQRRRVDNGDSHRLAPGIAGPDHDLDGVIKAAGTVGKHRRKPPARTGVGGPIQPGGSPSANHLHLPRCGRRAGGQSRGTIGHAAGRRRRHCHQRLLVAAQSADVGRHHELPSAHERGGGPIDREATTIKSAGPHAGIHAVLFARHSPGKFRRSDPHPRRRGPADPWRKQPRRGHDEAFRRDHLIQAGEPHERGECVGQPQGGRPIDHGLRRQAGESLGGPPLERLHDQRRACLRMRLHEHGVDEVVVKFRVLLLDGPRRIDEIHAAAHQWYDPADDGCNERDPPRRQPRPTDAARQATGQQPMLDENAARQPDGPCHAGGEQKRRQGHALVVGTRGSEPLCQIAVRLGVGFAPSVPGAHG